MEKITILQEFLRKINKLMDPVSYDEKIQWLLNSKEKNELFEKYPKCVLPIRYLQDGNMQPYFFVCNRKGMKDPDMIKFALKLCTKLECLKHIDQEHLGVIRKKLLLLQSRYDKEVPTPYSNATRKAQSTQKLNQIIQAMRKIRNPNSY